MWIVCNYYTILLTILLILQEGNSFGSCTASGNDYKCMGATRLKFESWKVRIHIQNAFQKPFLFLSEITESRNPVVAWKVPPMQMLWIGWCQSWLCLPYRPLLIAASTRPTRPTLLLYPSVLPAIFDCSSHCSCPQSLIVSPTCSFRYIWLSHQPAHSVVFDCPTNQPIPPFLIVSPTCSFRHFWLTHQSAHSVVFDCLTNLPIPPFLIVSPTCSFRHFWLSHRSAHSAIFYCLNNLLIPKSLIV